MPGGSLATSVVMGRDGVLRAGGGGTARILARLPDTNPEDAYAIRHYSVVGTTAVFTWRDSLITKLSLGRRVTYQVQIDTTGVITIVFDDRNSVANFGGTVGIDSGQGSPTSLPDWDPVFTSPTIVSDRALAPSTGLDLSALTFVPLGTGGYTVTGTRNVGWAKRGRSGCPRGPALRFEPNGPGYTVTRAGMRDLRYRNGVAALIPTGGESATITLPFQFPFPGGLATDQIVVDERGFIRPAAATTSVSYPDIFTLLQLPFPTISPYANSFGI
jgi:hypothetical protein